jgi:hypothetical protein
MRYQIDSNWRAYERKWAVIDTHKQECLQWIKEFREIGE